jgi:hypothetical protein
MCSFDLIEPIEEKILQEMQDILSSTCIKKRYGLDRICYGKRFKIAIPDEICKERICDNCLILSHNALASELYQHGNGFLNESLLKEADRYCVQCAFACILTKKHTEMIPWFFWEQMDKNYISWLPEEVIIEMISFLYSY